MTLEWRRLCRKISMNSDPNIPALLIYISAMLETSLHVWSLPGLPAAPGQLFGVHPPQLGFGVHPSQHFLMSIWAFSGVHLSFLLSHPWHIHPVLSLAACTAAPSWLCCSTCLVPSVPSSSCDLITCCSSMELSLISSFFFLPLFLLSLWRGHTQLSPDKGVDRNAGESAGFRWGTDPFSLTGDSWVLTSAPSAGNLWILKTHQNREFYWTWSFSVRACCLTVHHPAPSMVLVPLLLILLISNLITKTSIIIYFFVVAVFPSLAVLVVCSSFLTAFPKTLKCSTAFKKWSVIKSEHYWVTNT